MKPGVSRGWGRFIGLVSFVSSEAYISVGVARKKRGDKILAG